MPDRLARRSVPAKRAVRIRAMLSSLQEQETKMKTEKTRRKALKQILFFLA
jgi:hypothetical protein